MFRAMSLAIVAGVSLITLTSLGTSIPAEARGHGGHFGGHGGHFGGGHFGGRHFGGGHFGHFGGRHFGGGHFGGRHFGGGHFAHRFGGGHFAHRGFGGHRFAGRHFASHGRALAATGRMGHFGQHGFGRHGYGHGFAHNGFWGRHYANGGRYWGGYGGYGWYGDVFWPYAIGDALGFALWPYDYYDPFWGYGPSWIAASLFWPLGEPGPYYGGYGYAGGYDYGDIYGVRTAHRGTGTATASNPPPQQLADACGSLAPGVEQFPAARIEKAFAPMTDEQKAALNDVNTAVAQGADTMKQACPANAPLTPPAKLDAVTQRLGAMKTAIEDVRSPMDKFYGLLSADQQHRFDQAVLASHGRGSPSKQASNLDVAQLCTEGGPAFADLPAADIEKAVKLDDTQRGKLGELKTASSKAEDISKGGCISSMPSTVGGRLDATEKRVDTLIEAANTLKPAVDDFYASLSDEQKARFNSMGGGSSESASGPQGAGSASTGTSSGEAGSSAPH